MQPAEKLAKGVKPLDPALPYQVADISLAEWASRRCSSARTRCPA